MSGVSIKPLLVALLILSSEPITEEMLQLILGVWAFLRASMSCRKAWIFCCTFVGGLVSKPVIALPTSVGYGASFGGVAALLGMLNSCAAGVSVVNIDNGFGAGRLAGMMNSMR